MEVIEHEVFGSIKKSGSDEWTKELKIFFFGEERNVILNIFGDKSGVGKFPECEISAYKNFFEDLDKFLRKTEIEVYKYYQSVCEEYRDAIGDDDALDEIAPIINSKEEINDLVSKINIYITDSYDDTRNVGIGMECTWEDEHGLGVRFENEEVVAVGYYSEVY